jgi:hypothetical protein
MRKMKKDKYIVDSELEKEIDSFLHPISKEDFVDEPFTLMAKCARHFAQWQKEQTEKRYLENAKKYDKNYPNDVVTKVFGVGNLESWEYDDAERIFGYACEAVIEKACKWLSEIEDGTTITDVNGFVEGFRKEMRG